MAFETKTFRRVVTGHDEHGIAKVVRDDVADCVLQRPTRPGVTLTNIWQLDSAPAEPELEHDPVEGPLILHPPQSGSVFRIIQFDPEDPDVIANIDGKAAFAEMGAGSNVVENARHPYMHRTDSVDYTVVLSGEIYMLMDEEDVLLKAGDTVIQQGTNHAWSNRSDQPCLMMFVLNDARKRV